jgi:ABC-2 type transport system ATP-binding protein
MSATAMATRPSVDGELPPSDSQLSELLGAEPRPRDGTRAADAIVVDGIAKRYPNGVEAVRGISFRVRTGEVYGILGPNGAGKSTMIGMLGTLVRPTAGHASVAGFDVTGDAKGVRASIGFAMQEVGVDELASGMEFLVLQGRLQGLSRREASQRTQLLLELFDLDAAADQRLGEYSGGMKRRIDLASALIHLPPILFLDEPTEGLDPRARVAIWETLERLNTELQMTVVLTTHYMEEADRLCARIGIIDRGRIVVEGTPAGLKASVGGQTLSLHYPDEAPPEALARVRRSLLGRRDVRAVVATDGDLSVDVEDAATVAPELLRLLERDAAAPQALSIKQPTLEDVYLRSTGRGFEEEGTTRAKASTNGGSGA